ncbi:MAG: hypothetical protein A2452_11145 [Candidatus Firestonebacteria bacterium RIFOXYC2_FULL_39_67]|nr:MAG: hypothetical protein A2452_11145 [Candidatus Firestonebacteria bacterium RIFOXYC2_FULL_39_67]
MDNFNNNWKNEYDSGDGLRNIFKVRFEMLSIRSQLRNLIKKEIITYSQILEKEKFNVKIYICRAKCKRLIHQFRGAIEDCTMALSINNEFPAAWDERAFCHYLLKEYKKAIFNYTELLKLKVSDEAYYFRGISRARLKMYSMAIEDFTESIKMGKGEDQETMYKRAYCYLVTKKYDEAINDLLKALKLDSQNVKYLHYLGEAYKGKGDIRVAEEVFELEKELKPLAGMDDEETKEGI